MSRYARIVPLFVLATALAACQGDNFGLPAVPPADMAQAGDQGPRADFGPGCTLIKRLSALSPPKGNVVPTQHQPVMAVDLMSTCQVEYFELKYYVGGRGVDGLPVRLLQGTGELAKDKLLGAQMNAKFNYSMPAGKHTDFMLEIDSRTLHGGDTIEGELVGIVWRDSFGVTHTEPMTDFPIYGPELNVIATCLGVWTPDTVLCQNMKDGDPCDDGNPCTNNDRCQSGACKGSPTAYCLPCRSAADCCGDNMPVFCVQGQGHVSELRVNGVCDEFEHRCQNLTPMQCPNACMYPTGCQ